MNRLVLAVIAFALGVAAIGVALRPPESPVALADCRFAFGETTRTNCVTDVAISMFRAQPEAAIAFTEANLPNALDRDFVYLQVTLTIDAKTPKYCMKIADKIFRQQCTDRVQRPHLDGERGNGPRTLGPPPVLGGAFPKPGEAAPSGPIP